MALNGISTLATKQLRQEAKLALAKTNREAGGDNTHPAYRVNNDYDISKLPTNYVGDDAVDTPGSLDPSRPWKPGI